MGREWTAGAWVLGMNTIGLGARKTWKGESAHKSSSGCCCQEKMSPSFPLVVVDVCFWTMGTPMPIKTRATTRKGNVTERHTAFPA